MLSQQFIDEMKSKLLVEKVRLEEELKGLAPHTEIGNSLEDAAEEFTMDEVNRDIIARIMLDLAKIEKALLKVEDGTYGTDDDGKEIGEDRLRVIPFADKAI